MERPTSPSGDDSARDQLSSLLKGLGESSHLARLLEAAARQVTATPPQMAGPLAGDILYGADGIAEFLYGDAKLRRKVYNLVETGRIPHFKLGAGLCARKSVLLAWIAAQERVER